MNKNLWTAAGILRLSEQIVELDWKVRSDLAHGADEQHRGRGNEDQILERASALIDEEATKKRLELMKLQLRDLAAAPTPTTCTHAQIGHKVRISYSEQTLRKARGAEETFILGGEGETDHDSVVRTISTASPLGKALLGEHVGSEVHVEGPDALYSVRVVSIELPQKADSLPKAKAA